MSASRIRILSDQTINKIAAGEVIENPASVIKELIENALDAQSTRICVEIREGGRQLIRVSDDGCGMFPDDALLSLERHATSKIREVDDIEDLVTLGFRGEALPSIASISKLSLLTSPRLEEEKKREREEKGTLILIEGGRLISSSPAPRSPGTTLEVKSLFFNVPVRRKFQKSPAFDTQEILKMIALLALAYPTVYFELVSDEKLLLKTPLASSPNSFHDLLGQRLECVLGQEYSTALFPLKFQKGPYELEGYISSSMTHRPNRTGQHLFINQRMVASSFISSAIREGYGTMLPTHRYPLFVLHLRMPGSLLDVNVHPQKKEVRLRQEFILKETIIQAVQMALRQDQKQVETIPLDTFSKDEKSPIPSSWVPYASLLSANTRSVPKVEEKWEFLPTVRNHEPVVPVVAENSKRPHSLFDSTQPIIPRILTTIVDYCIFDPFNLNTKLWGLPIDRESRKEGGLALLDQRAAYHRIHYERLLNSSSIESQSLLIPLTLHMTPNEVQVLHEYLPVINQMGFELREFGENAFVVDAYPTFLKQDQLHNCLTLILQDLVDMHSSHRLKMQKEDYLALAACRTLPQTKQLSIEEGQALIQQLLMCEIASQCPLGKPTCLYLAPEEIAKLFLKSQKNIKI